VTEVIRGTSTMMWLRLKNTRVGMQPPTQGGCGGLHDFDDESITLASTPYIRTTFEGAGTHPSHTLLLWTSNELTHLLNIIVIIKHSGC
jgi:hypothetical protein